MVTDRTARMDDGRYRRQDPSALLAFRRWLCSFAAVYLLLDALRAVDLTTLALPELFLSTPPSAYHNSSHWGSIVNPVPGPPSAALSSEVSPPGPIAHLSYTPSSIGIASNGAPPILTWRIPRQETLFVGSHSDGREAAVAPAVAGGGGVTGGAGRVDSAPDWTVSSPLSERPLKERDLSLGFGTSSAHRPQEGNGLWNRNSGGYGFVGSGEGGGTGIPSGLGRQQDIFRDIVARGDEFGAAYGVGVRRDERGADEGRGSFVAYVGGEGRVHVGGPNREESGSGSTGPVSGKRKGADEEGATVEGGIWGNTVLRESADAFKRRRLDVSASMRGMDVQTLGEVRPGDSRVDQNKDDNEHSLQLHDPNRAKPVAQPQPGAPVGVNNAGAQGGTACLECGNQAKKDCLHQRCRTCCKSRGLQCPTHIKSTWVPAAKRRERQAAEAAAAASGQPRPKSKRARSLALSAPANPTTSLTNTSAGTSPRGSDINSGHQVKGPLPPEVKAHALFKCVRVTGVEDGENEFAYQATVKIGGHIFKGVLYDQGLDNGGSSAQRANVADLQLGGRSMPSSSALIDPTSLYGNPGSALLGALR